MLRTQNPEPDPLLKKKIQQLLSSTDELLKSDSEDDDLENLFDEQNNIKDKIG